MTINIITGDCREVLRTLPECSAHTCITSPPYFGLRDYGMPDQIGLEPTPDEFVAAMVAVFREVRRVLRDDGTLWLNLGDSYAGSWGAQGRQGATGQMADRAVAKVREKSAISAAQIAAHPHKATRTGSIPDGSGLKSKDLIGIPWRVAFALQADGWYLRQDIIWHKPNPMPESVRDRCTKAHEYLFLLSKGPRYYFDQAAIAEPALVGANGSDFVSDYDVATKPGLGRGERLDRETRNRRSVWTVATRPFTGAHFATFPPDLIRPCVLAGAPRGGIVLDPFGGAGTTGLVADQEQRDAILIELNPAYAEMARERVADDAGMFARLGQ